METLVRKPIAPTLQPLIGSLMQTADVRDNFDGWLLEGSTTKAAALFESFGSMAFGRSAVFCGTNNKTLDQASVWIDGFPFVAYGGVICNAVGLDQPTQLAEVKRVFDLGESTPVEAALMDVRFSPVTGGSAIFTPPTDITPAAGAVKPKVGIALLEDWMSRRYVGAPTIHLSTVIASLVMGADGVALEENVLKTKLGSKIVNGAGYGGANNVSPAGVAAAVGEQWIYATGEVVVLRGNIEPQQAFRQSNNEVSLLAERPYIVAVDGPVAAVRVQVTA